MARHIIFVSLVVALSLIATQFSFLRFRLEVSAEKFLSAASLSFYDAWVPPPSLFTFFGDSDTPLSIGSAAITVRLADTPEEQGVGLSGLRRIREDEGLLYIYPRPDFYTHSAKDMRFPLDIIWIGANKKIVDVITDIAPDTYPDYMFINDFLAQYVLELRAGFFEKRGLNLGDAVEFELEEVASQ